MTIPFRVKLLTETAKVPEMANEGDLFDLFADDFCAENLKDLYAYGDADDYYYSSFFYTDLDVEEAYTGDTYQYNKHLINTDSDKTDNGIALHPQGRVLVKTGIAIELPKQYQVSVTRTSILAERWFFKEPKVADIGFFNLKSYAVADIRPRSGLALKHGITVLNTPGTIDNSYRKEIGVILYNAGHKPYTIKKGDKIAQMLIRPLYPSSFAVVEDFGDTGRGGFGSTGK